MIVTPVMGIGEKEEVLVLKMSGRLALLHNRKGHCLI